MELNELIDGISTMQKYTLRSGAEVGEGLKAFAVLIERFNNLSDEEQKQFLIDGFNRMYKLDKDAIESFERRHPNSWLIKHIIKEVGDEN